MAYTVKKLSAISGVTVRTLHFYEEEGLLKPAYYGSNGYRYYEEKELLQLQQILFFKELGFSIKQIRKVVGRSDFDQLAALYSHRQGLEREREKIGQLLKTIDKTIKHIKGSIKMEDKEIFEGLTIVTKATGHESYFAAEEIVLNNVKKQHVENQDKSYHQNISKIANDINRKIVDCMKKGLKPDSDEVQRLIKSHHAFAEQFYTITKEVYRALAQLNQEHPAFRAQLDAIHPKLAPFMAKAMKLFAEREL